MLFNSPKVSCFCLLLLAITSLSACGSNNRELAAFDLGYKRAIKVTTGWADPNVPVLYETYEGNRLTQECVVFFESANVEIVNALRFKTFSDKSNQVFVLMQEAPETDALAIVDFSTRFKFPCCGNDNGAKCINQRNKLAELLERDNPGIKVDKLPLPEKSDTN